MLIIKECRSFLLVLHSFYNQWDDHPTMHLSLQVSASAPFRVVIIDAALFANVSIFLFFPKDIKIIFFIFL